MKVFLVDDSAIVLEKLATMTAGFIVGGANIWLARKSSAAGYASWLTA